ncbi:hypothetical protein CC1G_04916 [Coprinopsis cinerea okayama7|uniref:DUF6533 domain-containing protein n=1 Tax=Coprinopsis cinerea (strain Okayama-7 / 130 / ATCC MYA-4618 / FGSC 9003) TaxID=240176 RepID=A8PFI8_COPC7|nr:hypothetical protein CC1G_04916 [Coprinopsis cinerea okayama7\|eukprot:XP_001841072.2 hypothetical protein CC1G_04916 [Coprinopsis cinerea okayama7\
MAINGLHAVWLRFYVAGGTRPNDRNFFTMPHRNWKLLSVAPLPLEQQNQYTHQCDTYPMEAIVTAQANCTTETPSIISFSTPIDQEGHDPGERKKLYEFTVYNISDLRVVRLSEIHSGAMPPTTTLFILDGAQRRFASPCPSVGLSSALATSNSSELERAFGDHACTYASGSYGEDPYLTFTFNTTTPNGSKITHLRAEHLEWNFPDDAPALSLRRLVVEQDEERIGDHVIRTALTKRNHPYIEKKPQFSSSNSGLKDRFPESEDQARNWVLLTVEDGFGPADYSIQVASIVILYYDYILTLPDEITYIWTLSRKTTTTLTLHAELVSHNPPTNGSHFTGSCSGVNHAAGILSIFGHIGIMSVWGLRTCAIYAGNRIVAGVLGGLGLATLALRIANETFGRCSSARKSALHTQHFLRFVYAYTFAGILYIAAVLALSILTAIFNLAFGTAHGSIPAETSTLGTRFTTYNDGLVNLDFFPGKHPPGRIPRRLARSNPDNAVISAF